MSNAEKLSISLNGEILKKGKARAKEMGMPFSTYLSYLISKDVNEKEKK
jgi:predicted DNA binding CopG/RHH family protein